MGVESARADRIREPGLGILAPGVERYRVTRGVARSVIALNAGDAHRCHRSGRIASTGETRRVFDTAVARGSAGRTGVGSARQSSGCWFAIDLLG